MLLVYIADAIWIVALSVIAGASRQAFRRIGPQVRVPLPLGAGRTSRGVALVGLPVLATVIGLLFLLAARTAESADAQLLIFGVRAFVASIFALAHFVWLTGALRTLGAEGALKP